MDRREKMRTLAINKSYIPTRIVSKYEAICKVYCGNAEAITFENGDMLSYDWDNWMKRSVTDNWPTDQLFINSTTQRIAIPRVIRYIHYNKIPKATLRLSRKAIYARDDNTCYICGHRFSEKKLTIDHIVPQSRQGKNTWENLITCCQDCNWKKGNKTLQELGVKPKFAAYKPNTSNIAKLKLEKTADFKEWEFFGV